MVQSWFADQEIEGAGPLCERRKFPTILLGFNGEWCQEAGSLGILEHLGTSWNILEHLGTM